MLGAIQNQFNALLLKKGADQLLCRNDNLNIFDNNECNQCLLKTKKSSYMRSQYADVNSCIRNMYTLSDFYFLAQMLVWCGKGGGGGGG